MRVLGPSPHGYYQHKIVINIKIIEQRGLKLVKIFARIEKKYGFSQMLTKILYMYNSSKQKTNLENYFFNF